MPRGFVPYFYDCRSIKFCQGEESGIQWHLAARPLLLNRRAFHRTEGAEHAAIPRMGAEQHLAAGAFVEELTGVLRHGFLFGRAAMRAGQHGFEKGAICWLHLVSVNEKRHKKP